MVQGVVSFLCDLYSGRSPEDVLSLGSSLAQELKLEGVLSLTRRRAVASALSFFAASAAQSASVTRVA
jgi:sulfur transfer protein SufE